MTIHIVGLGLMGSALARVLSQSGHRVTGEDSQPAHHAFALHHGYIVHAPFSLETTDILVLALPLEATVSWLRTHQSTLSSLPLIVDITGIKAPLFASGLTLLHRGHYVSLHPMTGHPSAGPENSETVTFNDRPMLAIKTPLDASANALLFDLISALGCLPITWMGVEEHDHWITYSSHVPHVLAGVLASLPKPNVDAQPGPSLASFLRLASMQPKLWSTLFLTNATRLLPMIEASIAALVQFQDGLIKQDLTAWFDSLHHEEELR